jgi:hypothetical protein
MEGGFHRRAFVVSGQELITVERVVMEHLLKQPADFASR